MKFAYADPPYYGLAAKFYGELHPDAEAYDHLDAHRQLIERLCTDYADGWAMSLHSPSLKHILPLCPDTCRVMAWVKPFAAFKLGVGVAYAWEPIIVSGGRKRSTQQRTVRDWCSVNAVLKRGFIGAKPIALVHWILQVLNVQPGDTLDDLFPGSQAVTHAINGWLEAQTGNLQMGMFEAPLQVVTDRRLRED